MAQANMNAAAANQIEGAEMSETEAAFAASIVALETAAAANAKAKGDNKPLAKAVQIAERNAAWCAFDCVAVLNDSDTAAALGEAFARQMAEAKGLGEASTATYAHRGRMLYQYRTAIAKEGETKVLTKGANKGDTVNGREKANPISIARRLYEQGAANRERRETLAPYMAEAITAAAAALGIEEAEFHVLRGEPGEEGTEAREALASALDMVQAKRNAFATLRATLALLESDEAKAEAAQIMVQALGVKLAD